MINSHLDPELLSAYIDDEVSAEERHEVETHLNTCQECRQELDSLRWTVGLFREMPAVEVPRPLYVREADLAMEDASDSSWIDQLAAFVGTFRLLSYASAVSFALVLLLTVSGALPTGFDGAGGMAEPAADTTMMQQAPSDAETAPADGEAAPAEEPAMEMEAESVEEESVEEAGDAELQEEPAADTAQIESEAADDGAESAAAPEPEATQAPRDESAAEPEIAELDEQPEQFSEGATDGDGAATTERAVPQPPSEQQSFVDRIGLSGWLLLITGLGTLIFGGLARWLPRS